jgi:hypothetical protein
MRGIHWNRDVVDVILVSMLLVVIVSSFVLYAGWFLWDSITRRRQLVVVRQWLSGLSASQLLCRSRCMSIVDIRITIIRLGAACVLIAAATVKNSVVYVVRAVVLGTPHVLISMYSELKHEQRANEC